MAHNCFLSVVVPIMRTESRERLQSLLSTIVSQCAAQFDDYEIILVDNKTGTDLSELGLDEPTRNNCYIVQLAKPVVWDSVILGGMERANGDYIFICDPAVPKTAEHIEPLYRLAQDGNDITYLRNVNADQQPIQRRMFYSLIGMLSSLQVDPRSIGCFMISRRAANAIASNWSPSSFFTGAVFGSGFVPAPLDVDGAPVSVRRSEHESHNVAWAVLTRSARLPLLIGRTAVLVMAAASVLSMVNALSVRLFSVNILGQPEVYVPGWAFVVILVSLGFLVTNVSIYVLLRFMYVLMAESDQTPNYTVQRFGRLS